jgi:hypothetical protein
MDGVMLLRRARAAGLAVAAEPSGKLVIRGPRRAEATARLLLDHKPVVIEALTAHWRARHREALAHWSTFRPIDEAAGLAWGELEDLWHRLHGSRAPVWQCAGCGEPIGGLAALRLADSNRVHLGDSLDCMFTFGQRWRGEATAGLRALGLDEPPDRGSP